MSYLPRCPPVKYSENKNISNSSTNNLGSLGTTVSIYSKLIQQNIGKKGASKLNFANLALDPFGGYSGISGGSNSPLKNKF